MTLEEFIKQVEMLRTAQREYFKFRRPSDLQAARDMEHRIDAVIKEHKKAAVETVSPKLF